MSVARGGRLPKAIDEAMQNINASVHVDSALWREDIQGSIAHAAGLARAGVISQDDCSAIIAGLRQVAGEIEAGNFTWDPSKEDVHMNVEPVAQAALDGVAEIVSNRTSAYSGFLVRCAARGMVSAPVERVLRAIQAGAPAVAAERGEAVAATGHSSGVDTLAGLVCGTEAALGAPL